MKNNSGQSGRSKKGWKKWFLPGLILLPLLVFLSYLFLHGLGAYLIVADPLEHSDAIVILSGGGPPRLEEAGRLYKEEWADKIILTETGSPLQGYNQTYSYNEKLLILDMDIPPTAVFITDEHAHNTYAEAVSVKDLMQKHHYASAIVITDPYHTRRARLIFRSVFNGTDIAIRIRPVSNHWYQSGSWFLHPAGWKATLSEYLRLLLLPLGYM